MYILKSSLNEIPYNHHIGAGIRAAINRYDKEVGIYFKDTDSATYYPATKFLLVFKSEHSGT